jgi:isoquinoline 1-oxidoreductase beta subunit
MKFAVIARSPVLGGKIVSFDAPAGALQSAGRRKVVQIDPTPARRSTRRSRGFAVIATTTYAA